MSNPFQTTLPPWDHQDEFNSISNAYHLSALKLQDVQSALSRGTCTTELYSLMNKHFNQCQHPEFHKGFTSGSGKLSAIGAVVARLRDGIHPAL